ncbi:MAG: SDR family NAD(P)-dependent oxidoreductase [Negativicutes bacterium]|nr:SDR family NAD(P)-dependent oxidoreductase [Negativicutes bacterium]
MDLGLKDKVAVVTGGATGIGLACAVAFAGEGSRVAVCGRRAEKIEAVSRDFAAKGYELFAKTADVSQEEELRAFAAQVFKKYGRIDVWINNAGISPKAKLLDMSGDEWDEVMRINLKGVFLGSQIAARYMKDSGGGVILNAASYAAVMPSATSGAYAAAKAGVTSLTRSMAAEFARFGIRVVAYIPGMVATDINRAKIEQTGQKLLAQISMNRFGEPAEVARALVFLASDAASYITGTAVEITGGKFSIQNPEVPWTW